MRQLAHTVSQNRAAGAALFVALAALAACSGKSARHDLLNDQEYAPYRFAGNSVIEGQVVARRSADETSYGSNCQVRLMPVTTETSKYVERVVLAGKVEALSDRPGQVSWITTADDMGRFRFTSLPPGDYYLTCRMAWRQDGKTHDGMALGRAHLDPAQTIQVEVAPAS